MDFGESPKSLWRKSIRLPKIALTHRPESLRFEDLEPLDASCETTVQTKATGNLGPRLVQTWKAWARLSF